MRCTKQAANSIYRMDYVSICAAILALQLGNTNYCAIKFMHNMLINANYAVLLHCISN